jgi:hypothetical protein
MLSTLKRGYPHPSFDWYPSAEGIDRPEGELQDYRVNYTCVQAEKST